MSKVLKGQCLHDIAIQELGSADKAFDIAVSNDMAVTDLLSPEGGVVLPGVAKDKQTATYYNAKALKPATENRGNVGAAIGVNFWAIEADFVVS